MEISNEVIRIIALQYGFKLKEQPSGENDLNPYVYRFARKLINMATEQVAAAPTPPAQECKCDMRTKLVGDGCEACNPELAAEMAAQEDEPVAWLHDKEGRVDCIHDSVKKLWVKVGRPTNDVGFYKQVVRCKVEHYTIPLYTRPADDKLRKAAEETLNALDDPNPTGIQLLNARDNLRAALEGKSTPSDIDKPSPA